MRLATFEANDGPVAAVLVDDRLVPVSALEGPATSVRGLLERLDHVGLAGLDERARQADKSIAVGEAKLRAPVPDPQKIICLGLNYRDHAEEAGLEIPAAPMWFAKFANSLIGSGEPIVLPVAHPDLVDYEAELAVVVGRTAKDVSPDDALDYIAGAMPFNDVSARDLQLQNPLWTSGKAVDTFAPCGPALVTLDELGDMQALGVRTRINGELLQEGNTRDQIFGVAETIAWLSRTMTLLPGDIVATGTPSGIGAMQNRFLRDGDLVEVEVDGLGVVSNPVQAS